jgi:hypothetical protein
MTVLDEIKDFATFRDNGITYEGKPMIIHQKKLRAFLLFYKQKTLWEEEGPTEDDVLGWTFMSSMHTASLRNSVMMMPNTQDHVLSLQ